MPVLTTADDLEDAKRCNQVRVRLKIGDESDIPSLVVALRSFQNTESELASIDVVACYEEDFPNLGSGHVYDLIEAIGDLQSVVHLSFENLGDDHHENPFPIQFVSRALNKVCNRLESLVLDRCSLKGTDLCSKDFVNAIKKLSALRRLEIINNFCIFVDDETIPLDDMVSVIANLPMIETIELLTYSWDEPGYPSQFTSSGPIQELISCPNLTSLSLGNFHLANEGLKDVLQALEPNNNLQKLELHFSPCCINTSTKFLKPLSKILLVNSTLEVLKLEFDECCPNLDQVLEDVASALAKNSLTNLRKLKLVSPRYYGATVEKSFLKTLKESNYSLEKLDIDTVVNEAGDDEEEEEDDDSPFVIGLLGSKRCEIELYLRLNARGRKYIMNNIQYVTRDKWVDTFATLSNDLDGLYYYLHMTPTLCQGTGMSSLDDNNDDSTTNDSEMHTTSNGSKNNGMRSPSRGARSSNYAGGTAEGYQTVMDRLQTQLADCFVEANEEIQQLNRKHAVEKSWLEKEVIRLREENAVLKARLPKT